MAEVVEDHLRSHLADEARHLGALYPAALKAAEGEDRDGCWPASAACVPCVRSLGDNCQKDTLYHLACQGIAAHLQAERINTSHAKLAARSGSSLIACFDGASWPWLLGVGCGPRCAFVGNLPVNMLAIAFGVAASLMTLAGGLLALRLRQRIVLVLGFTAGVVLGVAIFDLVPEALELARGWSSPRTLVGWVAAGLGLYMLLDRALGRAERLPTSWRAHLGPATLTLHSFLDGMGIGLAFQIDKQAGWLIAIAVLTHDLADGVNTVSLCLAAKAEHAARRWLVLNGAAPLLGVVVGLSVGVPPFMLAPLLALFAGVFLYIGACELVPRSYALDPRLRTTLASLAGMALMFVVTGVAG